MTMASPHPSVSVSLFCGVVTDAVIELLEEKLPPSMNTAESRLASPACAIGDLNVVGLAATHGGSGADWNRESIEFNRSTALVIDVVNGIELPVQVPIRNNPRHYRQRLVLRCSRY